MRGRKVTILAATGSLLGALFVVPGPASAGTGQMCGGEAATFVGNDNPETINGTSGKDVIVALGGNDTINGKGGDDVICTGSGKDKTYGGAGHDTINTGGGKDIAYGGAGDDGLWGDPSADGANEKLFGQTGNDFMAGYAGDDLINGGSGTDWTYYFLYSTTVNLAGGTAIQDDGSNDTVQGIENVWGPDDDGFGGAASSTLIGDENINYLIGGKGDDTLWGREGEDILDGGSGDDAIYGGVGQFDWAVYFSAPQGVHADLKVGNSWSGDCDAAEPTNCDTDELNGVEILGGSQHDDTLKGDSKRNYFNAYGGNDTIDGREGLDVATFFYSTTGINGSLATGTASGEGSDTFTDVEGLWGSPKNDQLFGDNEDNLLMGGFGDDQLAGSGGDDYLMDDAGQDVDAAGNFFGPLGSGSDSLDGGPGEYDVVDFFLGVGGVEVDLTTGQVADSNGDLQGDEILGMEGVIGSDERDILSGTSASDYLFGEGGDDEIYGFAGIDQLDGGTGTNTLDGGTEDDVCVSGNKIGCELAGPLVQHPLVREIQAVGRLRSHRPNSS